MRAAWYTLLVLSLVAAPALWWRRAARRRPLPCPAWLSWLLDNPYTKALAGAETLLDRASVEPGMRVLDVGCGPGRVTIPAAERVGPSGEVVALDVQEAMLARLGQRIAERGLANVRLVLGAVESEAFEPETFDRAILVTVLGEIPDRETAVRALHSALIPGGVLSVTELIPDPHYQSRRMVRRLAEAAGFRLDRSYGSPLAFTMNFRKSGR